MNKKTGIVAILLVVAMCFAMSGCLLSNVLKAATEAEAFAKNLPDWKKSVTATWNAGDGELTVKWDAIKSTDTVAVSKFYVYSGNSVGGSPIAEAGADATSVTKGLSANPQAVLVSVGLKATILGQDIEIEESPLMGTAKVTEVN